MPTNIEPDIFIKIRDGNAEAFNQLFSELYPQLCFFCNGYLNDMDLARSVVQQVFVDIWIKRDALSISHSVKSYMYNAVKNKAIDHLRKQKHTVQITENIENIKSLPFKDIVQEAEIQEQINKAINCLPEKCKKIFLLSKFEGMKYQQIADKLHISIKTVEMQMSIALKKLRANLSDNKTLNLFITFFSK